MLPLLRKREVAALLKVSTRTVERLAKSGQLPPALRVGGQYRWSQIALETGHDARRKAR